LLEGETFEEIRGAMETLGPEKIGLSLLEKIQAKKVSLSPEDLSLLEPLWKGLLEPSPDARLEDLEELDELLEIALEKHGGVGVQLARALENFGQRISEILQKNETKTLEKADLPFLNSGKRSKKGKKGFYFGACLFILIVLALVALVFFGRSKTSVDETGALLMQKTRDSQMQAAPDSVEMPNLEGVLERLKPEEGE